MRDFGIMVDIRILEDTSTYATLYKRGIVMQSNNDRLQKNTFNKCKDG